MPHPWRLKIRKRTEKTHNSARGLSLFDFDSELLFFIIIIILINTDSKIIFVKEFGEKKSTYR